MINFYPIDGSSWCCDVCGAEVPVANHLKHRNWHARLEAALELIGPKVVEALNGA